MAVVEVPADDPASPCRRDACRSVGRARREGPRTIDRGGRRATRATRTQWYLPQIGWDQAIDDTSLDGSAVVAILDTGVNPAHEDLSQHLLPGQSFVQDEPADTDPNGHGTWMAGIVAADTNNDVGIAGVAWAHVRVLPITVLGAGWHGARRRHRRRRRGRRRREART